ncbi:low molecular weight protein-tyrosine-phosphatase [Marinobacteraceae bacterium S3BR75-40.1]
MRILFVCLGNICRSPTAHGIFQHYVNEAGLADRIDIDSAGTGGWHVGAAPDKRAQEAARQRGYDLSSLRARQAVPDDFERFDYVLAMDHQNLRDLKAIQPANADAELGLFLAYGKRFTEQEVPDPYYGGQRGFEHVLDLVEDACEGLLEAVKERHL